MLLASVDGIEEVLKTEKDDVDTDVDELSNGRHIVTQDEIGQRILTALKKVCVL